MIPRIKTPIVSRNLLLSTAFLVATQVAGAKVVTYQYYRFTPTKLRNSTTEMQMSEFRLREGTTDKTSTATLTASNSSTTADVAEGFNKLKDGSLTTKWFTSRISPVVFSFTAPTAIDNYSYATGNDFDSRDPVSWTLEGSSDNATWVKVDVQSNVNVTVNRNVWIPDFTIPDELPPEISGLTATPSVVTNGGLSTLEWVGSAGATFTIGPGAINAGSNSFYDVTPPVKADTLYTVTATNSTGTASTSQTVRSVTGGSATWRYLRFTPIKLRDLPAVSNSIQVSEFFFYSNGDPVTAVTATNPGGSNPATETPAKAVDGDPATKWLDFLKKPLIIDFGTPKQFDSYGYITGGDAPERDPIRWTLEGSNDQTTWTRVDDLSTFDVNIPVARPSSSQTFPVPGTSLPPLITTFTGSAAKIIAGDPLTLTWAVTDASTLTLNPGNVTLASSGTLNVTPSVATTYTLTAKSPDGFTVTKTVDVAVATGVPLLPAYTNFDSEGGAFSLVGVAAIVNDFATTPNPGNNKRIRLTPDLTGRSGAAWFPRRLSLANGFDTTFGFMITKVGTPPGADGLAFVVQNSTAGQTQAGAGEAGFANSIAVGFDTYQNTGEASSALLKIWQGTALLKTVDLSTVAGITVNTTVTPKSLTMPAATATPHIARVVYAAGLMDVYVDGVQVVTGQAINATTAAAFDANGTAYAGFTGRTGGLSAANDITSWSLSLGGTTPVNPLAVTAYTINSATGQGSLTWSSNTGKSYKITGSSDLVTFTDLSGTIASQGASTTSTFTFAPGTKGFFRVEEQ